MRKLEKSLQGFQEAVQLPSGEEKVGFYNSFAGKKPPNQRADPDEIIIADENGFVDMIHNERLGMLGVQFHPESVMTQNGREILKNLLLKLIK